MNCPTCNVHIDTHPAGKCLNEWIATDIMGEAKPDIAHEHFHPSPIDSEGGNWYCSQEYDKGDVCVWYAKNFSGYIAAAWEVLEKLSADGYSYQVLEHSDPKRGDCLCELWKDFYRWNVNHQPTVPLAISRAAIKATHHELD